MGTVGWDIRELSRKLMSEVRARVKPSTARGYERSCELLIRLAGELGSAEWSPAASERLDARLGEMLEGGEIGREAHRTGVRTLRMLGSVAQTGEADFSRSPRSDGLRYVVSEEAERIIEEMLDHADVRPSPRRWLRAPMRHLTRYAADRGFGPLEMDDSLVMEFLIDEVPRTNAGSRQRVMQAVRIATGWLRENGGSVLRDYSQLSLGRTRPMRVIPAFSEAEIGKILAAIDATTARGKRDLAFVRLAYCTGLRGADLVSLKLCEVDWREHRLTTRQSKTNGQVTCELNGETMNALADYVLEARPRSGAPEVFLSSVPPHGAMGTSWIAGWFDRLCERAGVEKLPGRSFHSVRRGFETTLVAKGVPVDTASQMMGHASIASDGPYITFDAAATSKVSMGFDDVPIRAGRYLAAKADGGEVRRRAGTHHSTSAFAGHSATCSGGGCRWDSPPTRTDTC